MKKALLLIVTLVGAAALTAGAQNAPAKKKPTAEQKALRKEMIAKYDTNKNGRLSKDEIAKITPEDQQKLKDAGIEFGRAPKKQQ